MTYPTIRPELTLDFANSRQLDPRITFSRTSGATYLNPDTGLITTASDHEARFEKEGLLIEESRTNHCLHSDIDPTNWTQNGTSSLAVSSIPAPDGGTCYDLTTDNSGANTVRQINNTTAPVGTSVVSVFARFPNAGFTSLSLRNFAAPGGANFYASYIPATDSWSAELNCTGLPSEDFGNGWKRLTIVSTVSSSSGTNWILIGGGISTPAYTQQTCQIWGAQLEQGSFPTSYIPTTGSTATRTIDIAQITGDNFSSWYNQGEGSFIATADRKGLPSLQFTVLTTNGYRLPEFTFRSSGTASIYSPAIGSYATPGSVLEATFGWSFDGIGASRAINGAVNSVANSSISDTNTALYLGNYLNNATLYRLNGHISRLSYYSRRLTDSELQTTTL